MHRQLAAVTLAAAFLTTSCSGSDSGLAATEPTPFAGAKAASFSISPPVASSQVFATTGCPGVNLPPPQFNLNVQAGDTRGLLITDVRAQFVDTSSVQAPMVTLPAPVPTAQFGSMLVEARSQRSFPLFFGCGVGRSGTIVVIVDTRDSFGRLETARLQIEVR